jgi:hypothetical protein
MGHDWIYDVLKDLISYARANGLPAVAARTEELLEIARAEVAALDQMAAPKGGTQH